MKLYHIIYMEDTCTGEIETAVYTDYYVARFEFFKKLFFDIARDELCTATNRKNSEVSDLEVSGYMGSNLPELIAGWVEYNSRRAHPETAYLLEIDTDNFEGAEAKERIYIGWSYEQYGGEDDQG